MAAQAKARRRGAHRAQVWTSPSDLRMSAGAPGRRRRRSTTAWTRSRRPSFRSTADTCVFTVASLSTSRSAISAFESASATSRSTSTSRSVSSSRSAAGAARVRAARAAKRSSSRRVTVAASSASPARDHPDGLHQLGRPHVLEQEAARAGAQRGEHVLVDVVGREDDDPRRAPGRDDPPGGLDARRRRACARPSAPRRARAARPARPPPRRPRPRRPPRCPRWRRGSCESRRAPAPGRRRSAPGCSRPASSGSRAWTR